MVPRAKIHAMQYWNDCNTKKAQQRYKAYSDRSVQRQLRVEEFVYVEPPSLTMTTADRLATETYSKLLKTAVGQHTWTIEEDGILNTISIDCATRVPNPARPLP